jgi:hypothetical protein
MVAVTAQLLQRVPKPLRQHAESLLQSVRKQSQLTWTAEATADRRVCEADFVAEGAAAAKVECTCSCNAARGLPDLIADTFCTTLAASMAVLERTLQWEVTIWDGVTQRNAPVTLAAQCSAGTRSKAASIAQGTTPRALQPRK